MDPARTARQVAELQALLVGAVLAGTGLAAPAVAAEGRLDRPAYERVVTAPAFDPASGYASGTTSTCPRRTRPLAQGQRILGLAADEHSALLSGSIWFGRAQASAVVAQPDSDRLRVSLRCVRGTRLAGSQQLVSTTKEDPGVDDYQLAVVCPTGTVAYGGGVHVEAGTVVDPQGANVYGLFPEGRIWRSAVLGFGTLRRDLVASASCLPRTRLGRVVTRDRTIAAEAAGVHGGVASCPRHFFAFAGGAWTHQAGSARPMRNNGDLVSSGMTRDDRGWHASAHLVGGADRITVRVRCTTRLG